MVEYSYKLQFSKVIQLHRQLDNYIPRKYERLQFCLLQTRRHPTYILHIYLLLEGGRGIMHFGSNAFEDESITGYNMGSQEIKRFNKFVCKKSKK